VPKALIASETPENEGAGGMESMDEFGGGSSIDAGIKGAVTASPKSEGLDPKTLGLPFGGIVAGNKVSVVVDVLPKLCFEPNTELPPNTLEIPNALGVATSLENAFLADTKGSAPLGVVNDDELGRGANGEVVLDDKKALCVVDSADSTHCGGSSFGWSFTPSPSADGSLPSTMSGIDKSPRISSRLSCTAPVPNNLSRMQATR
jgi:hypothetical protein